MQQTLEVLFVLEEKSFLLLLDKQNLISVHLCFKTLVYVIYREDHYKDRLYRDMGSTDRIENLRKIWVFLKTAL